MSENESDHLEKDVEKNDSECSLDEEAENSEKSEKSEKSSENPQEEEEEEVKTDFKNKKKDLSSKYSSDTHNFFSDLKKGEFLIMKKKDSSENSSQLMKINNIRDKDDLDKVKINISGTSGTSRKSNKDDKIEIVVNKQNLSDFTLHKKIKIVLINYLNKIFEMFLAFNINYDFNQIKTDFCDQYQLNDQVIAIIFRDKKITTNCLNKFKLNKDFDFEKDFLLFVQAKPPVDYFRFSTSVYPDMFRNKNNSIQKRKTILISNQNIKVSSLYLVCGRNSVNNDCVAKKLEIFEYNQTASKFLKSKLSSKFFELCDKYNVDSLFNKKIDTENEKNNDDNEFRLIYSAKDIICQFPDKKNHDSDSMDNFFKHKLDEDIIFYSDKIYLVNIEANGTSFNVVKMKKGKVIMSDQDDTMLIFTDKKHQMSFISGMEFRPVTVFEI